MARLTGFTHTASHRQGGRWPRSALSVGLAIVLAGMGPGAPTAAAGLYAQVPLTHNTLTIHGLGCGQTGCGAMVQIVPPEDAVAPPRLPTDRAWGGCGDDQPLDATNGIQAGGLPCVIDYAVGSLDYPDGPPTVLILTAEQCRTAQVPSIVDGTGTQGPPDCSHAARFLGWGGDCGATGVGTDAGGACTLVMDQDHQVYIGYSYFECLADLKWADESQDNDARQVAGRFTASGTLDPAQCGYHGNQPVLWGSEGSPKQPPGANWSGLPSAPACTAPVAPPSTQVPTDPPALFRGLPGLLQILSTSSLQSQQDLLQALQALTGGCGG